MALPMTLPRDIIAEFHQRGELNPDGMSKGVVDALERHGYEIVRALSRSEYEAKVNQVTAVLQVDSSPHATRYERAKETAERVCAVLGFERPKRVTVGDLIEDLEKLPRDVEVLDLRTTGPVYFIESEDGKVYVDSVD